VGSAEGLLDWTGRPTYRYGLDKTCRVRRRLAPSECPVSCYRSNIWLMLGLSSRQSGAGAWQPLSHECRAGNSGVERFRAGRWLFVLLLVLDSEQQIPENETLPCQMCNDLELVSHLLPGCSLWAGFAGRLIHGTREERLKLSMQVFRSIQRDCRGLSLVTA
jgi:hypothetical protein